MRVKVVGYVLIAVGLLILFGVWYRNSQESEIPIVFSETEMMRSLWQSYKEERLEEDTLRALDTGQDNVTTSEGQSYTMLRAVWMDDRDTFDTAWQWTKDNLGREEDRLLAWLFGQRPDGTYDILTDRGGYNTASDADVDIALALIFAYARWRDDAYLGDARVIINDIWEKEVVTVNGRPYLAANNLEKAAETEHIIINPSYFAPYAYRIFAEIDSEHDWRALVDSSYDLLERTIEADLDAEESAGLPPDWVEMDRVTGDIQAPTGEALTTNYSYDALRSPWRIALDGMWFDEPRAEAILQHLSFLSDEWEEEEALYARYGHGGSTLTQDESPAMYGGSIGYFMLADSRLAEDVYLEKLQVLYDPDTRSWRIPLGYYDDNWAWFGIGLYHNLLPNLAESIDWEEINNQEP